MSKDYLHYNDLPDVAPVSFWKRFKVALSMFKMVLKHKELQHYIQLTKEEYPKDEAAQLAGGIQTLSARLAQNIKDRRFYDFCTKGAIGVPSSYKNKLEDGEEGKMHKMPVETSLEIEVGKLAAKKAEQIKESESKDIYTMSESSIPDSVKLSIALKVAEHDKNEKVLQHAQNSVKRVISKEEKEELKQTINMLTDVIDIMDKAQSKFSKNKENN